MKFRILLLAAVLVLLAAPAASACPGADADPAAGGAGPARAAVVCLVNQERAAHGLGRLAGNRTLTRAGRRHARDMVSRGYFSHDTPEGVTPQARAAAYLPAAGVWTVGENLAWGPGGSNTPRDIVRDWMNSPSHRANVLRPGFREIGVGVVAGSPRAGAAGAFTYAAEFGSR